MKNEIFLDTSYAVALSSPKDSWHQKFKQFKSGLMI